MVVAKATKRGGTQGEVGNVKKIACIAGQSGVGEDFDGVTNGVIASVGAVIEVPKVVTPKKPGKEASRPDQWFMINMHNSNTELFETEEAANFFKDRMVRMDARLEPILKVEQFESEKAAMEFVAVCKRMCGDNDTGDETTLDTSWDPAKISASVNPHHAPGVLPDDVVDDDDDVPFESPSGVSMRTASVPAESAQMSAFAAATIGSGTSIDVIRWRLPESKWDVYAFQLMDGKEQYWSHKPEMWMLAVETEKHSPLFPAESDFTLHKAMNRCNSAGIRFEPCGESIIKQIKTKKNGKLIDQYLLYGLAKSSKTDVEVCNMVKNFVEHTKKPEIRQAYFHTITSKMQSTYINDDCQTNGKYWIKLASGANNMSIRDSMYLNEIFLDPEIVHMVNLAYNTRGAPTKNWNADIRNCAFGSAKGYD